MDRYSRKDVAPARTNERPPTDAWLFAQAILGKPIPDPHAATRQARAERERLEWLAGISTTHEQQLRKIERAEADARQERERLEWLASISTEHEHKLRTLLQQEAESREAQERHEQFTEAWNEDDHPRRPKGADGGQWVATTDGSSSAEKSPAAENIQRQTSTRGIGEMKSSKKTSY
jgi:hypothetical protein